MSVKLKVCSKHKDLSDSDAPYAFQSFSLQLTLAAFKERLEMVTGIRSKGMKLSITDDTGMHVLYDYSDSVSLSDTNLTDGCSVFVDGEMNSDIICNEDEVEKYVMSEKNYEKRSDSVRSFKKINQLGRFAPDADAKKEELDRFGFDEASHIKVGGRCQVRVPGAPTRIGCVQYVGKTKFQSGFWVGVEYDEPVGKNDGKVGEHRYFTCAPKYGGFSRPQCVTVGDFPPESYSSDDEF